MLSINCVSGRIFFELPVSILNFGLQVYYLLLVLLDDFLAKVGALGELLLDFFMILQILRQVCDDTLHFMVLEH